MILSVKQLKPNLDRGDKTHNHSWQVSDDQV